MLAAHCAPASLCEFMLAGHSASSCDLSISIQDLALDAHGLELPPRQDMKGFDPEPDGDASGPRDDVSTQVALPPPRKFRKKSSSHSCFVESTPPNSSVEIKRAFRQALGLDIIKDEAAHWPTGMEARQVSAANVSKVFHTSICDK
jgi:hypothetical protein